jgi:hypothetical protein
MKPINLEAALNVLIERFALALVAAMGPVIADAMQDLIRTIHGEARIPDRKMATPLGRKTASRSAPTPVSNAETERRPRGRPRNADLIPAAMAAKPWWTMADLCATLGKTKAAMGVALCKLTKAGVVVRDPSVSANSPHGQRYALAGTKVEHDLTERSTDGERAADGLVVQPPAPRARKGGAALHGADRVADRAEKRARKQAREDKAPPPKRTVANLPPRRAAPEPSREPAKPAPKAAAVEEVADLIACHRPGLWLAVDGVVELLAQIKKTQPDPLAHGALRLKLGPVLERGHALGLLDREGADRHEWRYRAKGTRAPRDHSPTPRRGRP